MPPKNSPNLVLRVSVKAGVAMGPGKAALLRAIQRTGSIAAAARELEMSYSRAWLLVKSMNEQFREPLVLVGRGGASRGGAEVTRLGDQAVEMFEKMQHEAEQAALPFTAQFAELLR